MTHEQLLRIYWAANPKMQVTTQEGIGCVSGFHLNDHVFVSLPCKNMVQQMHLMKDCKPHLKPLSSITDEDMIAVSKMAIPNSLAKKTFEWEITRDRRTEIRDVSNMLWLGFADNQIYLEDEWGNPLTVHNQKGIIDYLRSKSYNLDFKEGEFIPITETLFPEKLKQAEELVAKYPIPDRLD